jgi:OmpA-OmpF porin, OOP family
VRTWTDFAVHPLVLISETGSSQVVVRNRTGEFLGVQAHVFGPLSVAVQAPLTLATNGDLSGLPPGSRGPSSLAGGFGDLRLTPRLALLRQEWAGIDLATQLSFDFPTARAETLTDDGRTRVEALLALGRSFGEIGRGRFELLTNAYVRLRPPREMLDVRTGNEAGVRAGLGWFLSSQPRYLPRRVYAELEGRTFLRSGFAAGSSPAEWRVGATVCPVRSLAIDLAGGGALSDGIGAPSARFLFGIGWSPASCSAAAAPPPVAEEQAAVVARPPPVAPAAEPSAPRAQPPAPPVAIADRDGDGVPDEDDTCPDQPGPVENHGCPKGTRHLVIVSRSNLGILEQVRFATGKARIERESFSLLDQVAEVLRSHPDLLLVRIEGHTDDRGSAFGNLVLSQARADSVAAYLEQKGVPRERLNPVGYGLARPIATNATAIGRAANRRVAFTILRTRSTSIDAERPNDS